MILPPLFQQENPSEEEKEFYRNLTQCVRCAVCLPSCPTYQETLNEGHSPRGRVSLVRALYEGQCGSTRNMNTFLYGCLECRACETACPNDVVFHQVIEFGKEKLSEARVTPRTGKFFKWLFLKRIFRRSRSLDRLMAFLRFYRRSGLQAIARFIRILRLFPWNLACLEQLIPGGAVSHQPVRRRKSYTLIPAVEPRGTVSFFTGCIADHWMQGANLATVRLLLRAGYRVHVPAGQQCCGALHAHLGETSQAMELAAANIEAFNDGGVDNPIVVNAAGCGAVLKEYGHLFAHNGHAARAANFSARVKDLAELLAGIADELPDPQPLDACITYDDPCHLIHAQGISVEPRKLIGRIPGIRFVELEEASWCCGSAGVYNVVNYSMSMKLLERKMRHVGQTGANILLTANPGCYLQLKAGVRRAGLDMEVLHIAEFLDSRYPGEPELSPESDSPPWL